jgi:hypothetical protein
MLKVAVAIFVLGIGAFWITAWFSGAPEPLPFEYEGFD